MLRRYFKNSSIIAVTQIILQMKNLVFLPFLTRHFGTLNYGVWAQVGVLVPMVAPLIILSTDGAVCRYLSGQPEQIQKKWFSAWMIFLIVSWSVTCSILYLFKVPVSHVFFGDDERYIAFIPPVAGMLLTTMILNSFRTWFRVRDNAFAISFIDISQAILSAGVLMMILLEKESIYRYVLASVVADAFLAILLFLYLTHTQIWASPDFRIIKKLLRFGLPLLPVNYASWGLNSMDRIFLVQTVSLAAIGIYSLSYSLGYLIIPLFMRPFRLMYPTMAAAMYNNGKTDQLQTLFDHAVGTGLALALPAAVGLMLLAKPIIAIFATRDFISGAPITGLISFAYIFHVLSSFFSVQLGLVHRQHYATISIMFAVTVNLILNMALIPEYGILGAAIATNLAFLSQLICTFVFSQHFFPLHFRKSFILKVSATTVVMGMLILMLRSLFSINSQLNLLELGFIVFTAGAFYIMSLFFLGILTRNQVRTALLLFAC